MAEKEKGNNTTIIILFTLLGILAAWAMMPPEYLMNTLQAERAMMAGMGGINADRWVYTQASSITLDFMRGATNAIQEARDLPAMIRHWAQERAITTWLWTSLIAYRAYTAMFYFIALFPLVVAASMDGWGVREISTHRFSAQSAIRHRMGVVISNLTIIILVVWLAMPLPIPAVIAPLAILSIGFSSWVWLSNLQKRI